MSKDPDDDDEDLVSSIGTLEDAMLSLTMAYYYHILKSNVMLGTKMAIQGYLSGIGCFIFIKR